MRTLSKSVLGQRRHEHRTFLLGLVKLDEFSIRAFRTRWHMLPSTVESDALFDFRDELQAVWTGSQASRRDIINRWLSNFDVDGRTPFVLDWTPEVKRIRPNATSFPIALAHATVHFLNALRYCPRPECPNSHYFVSRRADQKYCKDSCQTWSKHEVKRRCRESKKHVLKERRCMQAERGHRTRPTAKRGIA
jgi:hypothetical protein